MTSEHLHQGQPLLATGQIIPAFSLPGPDGMAHSPWDYKQREHIVLIFINDPQERESRGVLRAFAAHYQAFREEQCAILAITTMPVLVNLGVQEALHLPFPLLADKTRHVSTRYTLADQEQYTPCIVLADRYGALYQQWIAQHEEELPTIDELLASLRYLNSLCTP